MEQRGRKKAIGLAVVHPQQRPAPPAELGEFEASIWLRVVNAMPGDWIQPEHYQLLLSYCKHVGQSALVDRMVTDFRPEWAKDDEGLKRLDRLLGMRYRETQQINALSRAMRLTHQAQYHPEKAATRAKNERGSVKPWEG